jgi:hypothetical protein
MSMIDKERIAAVATLKALGYAYSPTTGWSLPAGSTSQYAPECDAMHALPIHRADMRSGGAEGSAEADELRALSDTNEPLEATLGSDGREAAGKA